MSSNDDKLSRQVAEERREKIKAAQIKAMQKTTLDDLFNQMQEGEMKELNLIVKADVQGSVEAVRSSLEKLSNDEVRVRCIHGGAGAINESDVIAGGNFQRHRHRIQRASGCEGARSGGTRGRGRSSLPRHLRCDRGNQGGHEGHARPEVQGSHTGSCRSAPDLPRLRRGHHRGLLW